MVEPQRPPQQRPTNRWWWILLASALLLPPVLGYLDFFGESASSPPLNNKPDIPIPRDLCMDYPSSVYAQPGRPTYIDVTINFNACVSDISRSIPNMDSTATPLQKPEAQAATSNAPESERTRSPEKGIQGGRADVSLTSTLPGIVKAVAEENQPIGGIERFGYWSWQVQPNEAGNFEASLAVTILDAEGTLVEIQNPRRTVQIHSTATFTQGVNKAATSTETIAKWIGSIVGAAILVAGSVTGITLKWRKDRREEKEIKEKEAEERRQKEEDAAASKKPGGYM